MSVQVSKVAIVIEFQFMGQLDRTEKERSPAAHSSVLEDLWMEKVSGKHL